MELYAIKMPDPRNDSRRAYGNAPVNRRTTPKMTPKPPVLPPSVQARAHKARQRQLLGTPMRELLEHGASGPPSPGGKLHPALISAAVFAVAAVSALLLLRSGAGLALAATLAMLGAACWLWQRRSQHLVAQNQGPSASHAALASPFDAQALERIDAAFEETAAVVGKDALERLLALKTVAVRVAQAVGTTATDEHFTLEDRLYVIECIRRYIPDTLGAYLQVAPAQRALPSAQAGQSPEQLLLAQLALLQGELEQREQRLHTASLEPLLRQQRFLDAKAGRR